LLGKPIPIALDDRRELVCVDLVFAADAPPRQGAGSTHVGRFPMAAFQLEHHAFDVAVILMRRKEA
jgi:hypothetical protein